MKQQHRFAHRIVDPNLLGDAISEALTLARLGQRRAASEVRGGRGERVSAASICRLCARRRRRVDEAPHFQPDFDLPVEKRAAALAREYATWAARAGPKTKPDHVPERGVGTTAPEEVSPTWYGRFTTGLLPRVPDPARRAALRQDFDAALLTAPAETPALRQRWESVRASRLLTFWEGENTRQDGERAGLAESLIPETWKHDATTPAPAPQPEDQAPVRDASHALGVTPPAPQPQGARQVLFGHDEHLQGRPPIPDEIVAAWWTLFEGNLRHAGLALLPSRSERVADEVTEFRLRCNQCGAVWPFTIGQGGALSPSCRVCPNRCNEAVASD